MEVKSKVDLDAIIDAVINYEKSPTPPIPMFQCSQCLKFLRSRDSHKKHVALHTSPKSINCDFVGCEMSFKTGYQLKAHRPKHWVHEQSPIPCVLKNCSMNFYSLSMLRRHLQIDHGKEKRDQIHCKHCGKEYFGARALINHCYWVHFRSAKPHPSIYSNPTS